MSINPTDEQRHATAAGAPNGAATNGHAERADVSATTVAAEAAANGHATVPSTVVDLPAVPVASPGSAEPTEAETGGGIATASTATDSTATASTVTDSTATLPPPTTEPAATSTAVVESAPDDASILPPAVPPAEPPTAYGEAAPAPEEEEEEGMTMLEHLEELRVRIIVCSVAIAIGLLVSALPIPFLTQTEFGLPSVSAYVMELLARPAAGFLIYLKPGEGFVTYLQVAMMIGFALAMPVLTWQLIAFVLPALLPHEKKYMYMAIPGAMLSFALGIAFAYVLVLPVAIEFLKTFSPLPAGVVEVQWAFSEYMSTVTTLLLYMGIAFETPLLMFFLTKMRVLTPQRLVAFRKYALILAFIIGAMITPTPDPLNQTIVSLPIYLLFELGLLLSKLAAPRDPAPATA